jgi:DNA-binding Xre family transcriptional regulator
MVRLNVLELLQRQGHTKYWLYKQLGMSYQNFNKMVNNETQSIKLERIETLCMLLHCTPNDLFAIDWERPNSGEN